MIDKEQVRVLAEERMQEVGEDLFLVALNVSSGNKILVEVDRMEGNISIDDCVRISRNIEHNLDREVEDFSLEVTSAGIDKPFRVRQQYEKNIGKEVKVQLDHGKVEGELKEVKDEHVVVTESRKERLEGKKKKVWVTEDKVIPYEDIKAAFVKLKFKRVLGTS